MERNLINDPSKFEAKNIGGILTTRQLLTIVIASLAATPFVVLGLYNIIPSALASLLAFGIAIPIGYRGLTKKHGLYFEDFSVFNKIERTRPYEMTLFVPFTPDVRPQKKLTRKEKKARKREFVQAVGEDALFASTLIDD